MTTRMVSPMPLSDFVPDVTLIAFPIPVATARGAEHFLRESSDVSRQENGLDSDVLEQIPAQTRIQPATVAAVLDRCSQVRNQRPRKNLLIT
jgi:hypothetical protein